MHMTDAPRPMAPGCHQRVFCHSPVFLLSSRGAVGRKIGPKGILHFSREGMHYKCSKCFSSILVPRVRHFVLGLHLCFLLSSNIAHQALATGCENDVVVIQFIAQFADKMASRSINERLLLMHYQELNAMG